LIAINKESHALNKETRGFFKLIEMARMYREMGDMESARSIMDELKEKKEKEDLLEKGQASSMMMIMPASVGEVLVTTASTAPPVGEVEVVTGMEPMSSITTSWSPIEEDNGRLVSIVGTKKKRKKRGGGAGVTAAESQNLLEEYAEDDDADSSFSGVSGATETSQSTDDLVSTLPQKKRNEDTTTVRHSQLVANLFDDTQGSTIIYGKAKDM
jgi:FimV-like protein